MVGLLFWSSYGRIANVFKWLALVLFAYVLAGFLAHPNWIEDRDKGRTTLKQRRGATDQELGNSEIDVITGMLFSNLIMFFIILTTATTLNAHGHTAIVSARQAAEAFGPWRVQEPTGSSRGAALEPGC